MKIKLLILLTQLPFLIFAIAGCSQNIVPQGQGDQPLKTAAAVKGQDTFLKNCNRCHPGGKEGRGPAIINKPIPGFFIRFQVRHGLGAMPSFKKQQLAKAELDNIIKYLKER